MSDLDRYLTEEVAEKALAAGNTASECYYGCPSDMTATEMHASLSAVLPDIIQQAKAEGEPLPVVNHKGPYDTDASVFRTIAEKLRRDEPVGGSNASDALARLIDREVARADREQGGQP